MLLLGHGGDIPGWVLPLSLLLCLPGFMLLEYCPGTLVELLHKSGAGGGGMDELTVYTVISEVC